MCWYFSFMALLYNVIAVCVKLNFWQASNCCLLTSTQFFFFFWPIYCCNTRQLAELYYGVDRMCLSRAFVIFCEGYS